MLQKHTSCFFVTDFYKYNSIFLPHCVRLYHFSLLRNNASDFGPLPNFSYANFKQILADFIFLVSLINTALNFSFHSVKSLF